MKEQKKLMIQMSLLFLIVFVVFGVIIVNEKISPLKIPKVTEKISTYLNNNYHDLATNLKLNNVEYKNMRYEAKVLDKNNENYYFYVYYKNKEFTDTYKKDYIEGQSIISFQEEKIIENIKKKTGTTFKVTIPKTLDKYTETIRNKIINSKTPEQIKIYNLEADISVEKFDTKNICSTLKGFNNNLTNKQITPKNYTFIIDNPEDETIAIKINNLDSKIINDNNLNNIINDILNKKKSNLLNTYNITYEYLN